MNTQFLLIMLLVFFVIIVIEAVIILGRDVEKPPHKKKECSAKGDEQIKRAAYVSPDKMKQLREKEECERRLRAKKALEEGKIKVIHSKEPLIKEEENPNVMD